MAIGNSDALNTLALILDRQNRSNENEMNRSHQLGMRSLEAEQNNLSNSLNYIRQKNMKNINRLDRLNQEARQMGVSIGDINSPVGEMVKDLGNSVTSEIQEGKELEGLYSEQYTDIQNRLKIASQGRMAAGNLDEDTILRWGNINDKDKNEIILEKASNDGIDVNDEKQFRAYREGFVSQGLSAERISELKSQKLARKKLGSDLQVNEDQRESLKISNAKGKFELMKSQKKHRVDILNNDLRSIVSGDTRTYAGYLQAQANGELDEEGLKKMKELELEMSTEATSVGTYITNELGKYENAFNSEDEKSRFAGAVSNEYLNVNQLLATNPERLARQAYDVMSKLKSLTVKYGGDQEAAFLQLTPNERARFFAYSANRNLGTSEESRLNLMKSLAREYGFIKEIDNNTQTLSPKFYDIYSAESDLKSINGAVKQEVDLDFSDSLSSKIETVGKNANQSYLDDIGGNSGDDTDLLNLKPTNKLDLEQSIDVSAGEYVTDADIVNADIEKYKKLDNEIKSLEKEAERISKNLDAGRLQDTGKWNHRIADIEARIKELTPVKEKFEKVPAINRIIRGRNHLNEIINKKGFAPGYGGANFDMIRSLLSDDKEEKKN